MFRLVSQSRGTALPTCFRRRNGTSSESGADEDVGVSAQGPSAAAAPLAGQVRQRPAAEGHAGRRLGSGRRGSSDEPVHRGALDRSARHLGT